MVGSQGYDLWDFSDFLETWLDGWIWHVIGF